MKNSAKPDINAFKENLLHKKELDGFKTDKCVVTAAIDFIDSVINSVDKREKNCWNIFRFKSNLLTVCCINFHRIKFKK